MKKLYHHDLILNLLRFHLTKVRNTRGSTHGDGGLPPQGRKCPHREAPQEAQLQVKILFQNK